MSPSVASRVEARSEETDMQEKLARQPSLKKAITVKGGMDDGMKSSRQLAE